MSVEAVDAQFTESTALAVREDAPPAAWTPSFAVTVDDMVARVAAKHDFFDRVMRKDEHYGVIPGTGTKPTLLKPGAELLLSSMALYVEFDDAEPPVVDYGEDGREGLIHYRRRCQVFHESANGRVCVAKAEGSCTSREAKYRWRSAGAVCPDCGKELRMSKDRPEWYCWKKKGGCGATFPGERFKFEKVANPDLADTENTILKMADKRALVAATLIATGCSDIFTQDLDDRAAPPEDQEQNPFDNATPSRPVRNAPPPAGPPLVELHAQAGAPEGTLGKFVIKHIDAGFGSRSPRVLTADETARVRDMLGLIIDENMGDSQGGDKAGTSGAAETALHHRGAPEAMTAAGVESNPPPPNVPQASVASKGLLFARLAEHGYKSQIQRHAFAKNAGVALPQDAEGNPTYAGISQAAVTRLLDELDTPAGEPAR